MFTKWKKQKIQEQMNVIRGVLAPTLVLENGKVFHPELRSWLKQNIWVYEDRIVYVGHNVPINTKGTEIVDCSSQYLISGYIEPHIYPFQLYNPLALAQYTSNFGTTTFVNDLYPAAFASLWDKKKAVTYSEEVEMSPFNMYWWARLHSQTERHDEHRIVNEKMYREWIEQTNVIKVGEVSGRGNIAQLDGKLTERMKYAKGHRKQVEGDFEGAGEMELAQLKLLGVSGDSKARTAFEVIERMRQGFYVELSGSTTDTHLQGLCSEINEYGLNTYDLCMFTLGDKTASELKNGHIDQLIKQAIKGGIAVEEAYRMATYNPAKYLGIEQLHGSLLTGAIANINILEHPNNPTPIQVIIKGKTTMDKEQMTNLSLPIHWDIGDDDFQFSTPIGVELTDAVTLKPFTLLANYRRNESIEDEDLLYFCLIDRNGKWRVNSFIKGFADSISGFASTFSATGDIILMGKSKQDMIAAFNRIKDLSGGIVIVEDNNVIFEVNLPIFGIMAEEGIPRLIEIEQQLESTLRAKGYTYGSPLQTLSQFSSNVLPFVRITPKGIYDVKSKRVLYPAVLRTNQ